MKSANPVIFLLAAVIALIPLWPSSVHADDARHMVKSGNKNAVEQSLNAARDQLEQAFSSYRDEDVAVTREHLRKAKALLGSTALNSEVNTVKTEVQKLVDEIQSFEQKLAEGSLENKGSIVRFWRRATSFIRREAEQLVHQYVELSQNEKTFKHLLDAKMHLFIAEHDLFVSHNARDAYAELDQVLADLDLARKEATSEFEPQVAELSLKVTALQDLMSESSKSWLDNEVIAHLQKAREELRSAEQTATPEISLQIGIIRQQIEDMRKEVETVNLRNDYDEIMEWLKMIINKLESE